MEQSKGGTESEALGDGELMGMTHRYKGSNSKAKGSKGSKNDVTWSGNDKSTSNDFNHENWFWKLLILVK